MKKKFAMGAAVLASMISLSACGGASHSVERKYITQFDNYTQCVLLPAAWWASNSMATGRTEHSWNQEETQYISEGIGSIKVRLLEGNSYTGNIHAKNQVSTLQNINGASKISLDVFNPCDYALNVKVEIKSISTVMFSVSKECAPGEWSVVSGDIPVPDSKWSDVKHYAITVSNDTGNGELFTVYLDNFYLEYKK